MSVKALPSLGVNLERASVLIVEDEVFVALDLQMTLERLSYKVCATASRPDEALRLVDSCRPDIILMDIRLEGSVDGITLARQIYDEHHLPVIFVTAHADKRTLDRAHDAQAYGYLVKPWQARDLDIAVNIALHKHAVEMRFRSLFHHVGVGVAVVDVNGCVVDANRTLSIMLGRDPLKDHLGKLSHDDDAASEKQMFVELVDGRRASYSLESRYLRANGELAWGQVTAVRMQPGADASGFAIRTLSDITTRRIEQVVAFQENERRLISSELHDVISQPLASVFYRLQACEQRMPDGVEGLATEVAGCRSLVQRLLDDLSGLMTNLRSPTIDGDNVFRCIRDYADDFQQQTSIEVHLEVPHEGVFMRPLSALFLFRITQESLTNVRRHSGANRVDVVLTAADGAVRGTIVDNGRGIDSQRQSASRRLGMRAMVERAELIGGSLRVTSRPGDGVALEFQLPTGREEAS